MYAGYTYTQPLSETTKLRAGLGLGYEKYKDTVANEKGTVSTEHEAFYTKAHADLTSDLGSGWYLNPWAEVKVDLNAKLKHNATVEGASADINAKTRGWGMGVGANIAANKLPIPSASKPARSTNTATSKHPATSFWTARTPESTLPKSTNTVFVSA